MTPVPPAWDGLFWTTNCDCIDSGFIQATTLKAKGVATTRDDVILRIAIISRDLDVIVRPMAKSIKRRAIEEPFIGTDVKHSATALFGAF